MRNIQVELLDSKKKKENNILTEYIQSQENFIPTGINMINAPFYHINGYTGKNITIAVIDSGYTYHEDLDNNIIEGKNFTNEDGGNPNIYNDYNGHSNHVCGTIIGNKHILGVAPNSKLLILKVLDKDGNGNLENVINAINYAISKKVDIISLSLGCPVDIIELHKSIKKAVENDIMIVSASGNSGDNNANTNEIDYPSYYPEVISVGAVNNMRLSAKFTNSNQFVDILAPGVNIVSTYLNNDYIEMDGTSMACPHVTGALALLKEKFIKEWGRKPSYMELYAQLIKNTMELNGVSRKIQGNGMLFLK